MSANNYALLIGSNYMSTPNIRLNGCINDIVNIRNMLTDAYNYPMHNIVMLRDDSTNPALLPTYANIMSALMELVVKSTTSSQIWFHYSGHGIQYADPSANIIEKGLGDCIVPCDYMTAGFITQETLYKIISEVKCATIITIDACHSGSICDLEWSFLFVDADKYTRTQCKPGVDLSNTNIYMISACRDAETSADAFDSEAQIPMGAFTDALITCLRSSGHNIPLIMLYKEICIYLQEAGFLQVPVLSSSSKDLTANFTRL